MIRLVLALWLMIWAAGTVLATTEGWPALYDVVDVSSGDVLNIRAAPDAGSDVIGRLSPTATDIEIIRPDETGNWGLVNAREGTGWVSLAFMARQPGLWSGQFADHAQCFGTEPFWSVDLSPDSATFESPDALPLTFAETSELRSRNRIDRHTRVYEHALGGMVATLRAASCSDGMSDRAYGWEIDLLLVIAGDANAQMFSGCCSIEP
ncbi:MAG: SH3 domain-containing protein [Pseudomonadota bacterium]